VLATQRLFLPADATASPSQQARLQATLTAAARRGYPIRVAVIGTQSDLGSITELWRQPQDYAHFLGVELSLVTKDPVLVVMPNGYGLFQPGDPSHPEPSALIATHPPTSSSDLASAATTAIENLARASGHPIPNTTLARSASPGGSIIPWLAFAGGLILIAAAWTASLRAKPASFRQRHSSASPGAAEPN
jgi:hypothetical protein